MEQFLSRSMRMLSLELVWRSQLGRRPCMLRALCHRFGVKNYLWAMQVLLKDFAGHAEALTGQLREASEALARRTARPIRYLASSATSKEQIAREIARLTASNRG